MIFEFEFEFEFIGHCFLLVPAFMVLFG